MTARTTMLAATLGALLALATTLPAVAQGPGAGPAKLGKVSFPVSCNAAAQKEFEVAMAYYHSFAWPQLKASLDRVIQADPACGMAHWGRALGLLDALTADEGLAEAHNNLAFSLRMQGAANRERALKHYNRAPELEPRLAQAYMYLGVLFTQMGNLARARADHATLLRLDPQLAARLARIIAGAREDDGDGLAPQYD